MASTDFHHLNLEPVETGSLTFTKAKDLIKLLQTDVLPYAKLVSCCAGGNKEAVILDIEPEVPQHPVNDINFFERIAIIFEISDTAHQEVFALRKNFPVVPHTNSVLEGAPVSLCLYQAKYTDLKYKWTAGALLQQLHLWLNRTARGELHDAEQPLEQIFFSPSESIILPSALFLNTDGSFADKLIVRFTGETSGKATLIASIADHTAPDLSENSLKLKVFVYTMPPQIHGIVRLQPRTLNELYEYLGESGIDFLTKLRQQILAWKEQSGELSVKHKLLILLRIPKKRASEGAVESIEVWAFASEDNIASVGINLGLWTYQGDHLAMLIPRDMNRTGCGTTLFMLNTIRALSREMAAAFNGLKATEMKCMAIGLGSLGSQVVNNLMRSGQGQWTFVDDDTYLPHNVARHYLPGMVVGYGKAKSMQSVLEGTFEGASIQVIEADVLLPASDELREALESTSLILDMSASVAVARELALSVNSSARRASLFLNPSGTDLVFLAESKDRSLRLDLIEMEYYWSIIKSAELSNHLFSQGVTIRYSHACRDVSVILPQDQVALHAAIGSRAFQALLREELMAQLKVWRTNCDLSTVMHEFTPEPYQRAQTGEWSLEIASRVLHDMNQQRTQRLPSETGGVLIGTFDTQRKIIYVVGAILSPPDSIEWPTAYYRGTVGLQEELRRIDEVTGKQINYVGEWHSHPVGASTKPSGDDRKLFEWLQRHRLRDGLPAVIAIAGDDSVSTWYVDDLDSGYASYVAE